MKKDKTAHKIFLAVLLVCMTFFAVMPSFADTNNATTPDSKSLLKSDRQDSKHYLEEAVVKLLKEGKLSREKVEKIFEYKQKKVEELGRLAKEKRHIQKKDGKNTSMLGMLVQDGVITEEEARLIKERLQEMKEARLSVGLQGLVDKGVLTSNDIDNMRSYMLKVREERKADIEKLRSLTPEERKAYFKENKSSRKDILTRMVEDKIITEKQAEEIRSAVPELSRGRKNVPKSNMFRN